MLKRIKPNRKWNFELSENAQFDVKEIWQFISETNPISADKLIEELSGKFKLLAENPNLGKPRNEIFLNIRSFPFKKYPIFYVPIENGIEIFRVIHGSRNIQGLFEEFFENLK